MLKHHFETTSFYKTRLTGLFHKMKDGPLTWDLFRSIPILTRPDLQKAGQRIFSKASPKRHGKTGEVRTSGSTGRHVTVLGTAVTGAFFQANNLRYHLWHNRDFAQKTAGIRVLQKNNLESRVKTGVPWVPAFPSSNMQLFDIRRPVREQLDWLALQNPAMLLTYPTNLDSLLKESRDRGIQIPALREVSTFGENVWPELRRLTEEVWGAKLTDVYSSQELGVIGLQCPHFEHYHVMSENLIVEILDSAGNPCPPGKEGRVVVTDLHNFATGLIRYEIGDYAAFGQPCRCGRGLPVISHVCGRSRNMLKLANGDRIWPRFNSDDLIEAGPVQAVQVVQTALTRLEGRLVVSRKPTKSEEAALKKMMLAQLPASAGITIELVYVDDLPRSANGKFEDFKSEVPD
jgi:phenylacetate-CoA ligase